MSILVNEKTRVVIQGLTGREGSFHAQQMIEYGTKVVAGVTPGKGGTTDANGLPIFDTVVEAVTATGADASAARYAATAWSRNPMRSYAAPSRSCASESAP